MMMLNSFVRGQMDPSDDKILHPLFPETPDNNGDGVRDQGGGPSPNPNPPPRNRMALRIPTAMPLPPPPDYVDGQVGPAAQRLPFYYAHNAAAEIYSPMLPHPPFPMPDARLTWPVQVSSSGNVDNRHPDLINRIFQQNQWYTTQAKDWQLKQPNYDEVLGSGSSMKPALDQFGASELTRRETCLPKAPPVDNTRGPHKDWEHRQPDLQQTIRHKKKTRLEIPPTVNISREAVIATIGEEAFLRLRNEMIKHQKLFAEQVFELHRLIAVQREIARSRRASVQDKHKLGKPSSSRTLIPKEVQRGHNVQRQHGTSRQNSSSECVKEMFYLPPRRNDPFKVPSIPPIANQGISGVNPRPANAGGINTPWIYSPSGMGKGWLVAVNSPTEGLIFKPCQNPTAPSPARLMPPPIHMNSPKPAQRHPPSQQYGIRPSADILTHFPPHVTPSSNTAASAFDHVGKPDSYHHPKTALPWSSYKSLWNPSTFVSRTTEIDATQQTKYNGDSTASSSPPGRYQGNILPLFPEEPTAIALLNTHQRRQGQSTSATESAAQIIRSTQEEKDKQE